MESLITNFVLLALVVVLAALLFIRQKQLKEAEPPADLEKVLQNLTQNLISSRTEGKIQKVASQLSDILINSLHSQKIFFFRRQRRFMELNYVYGLKNIQRAKYRIRLTNGLLEKLTDSNILRPPVDLYDALNADLREKLDSEGFNLAFPIFWKNNLFGVYFIGTSLKVDNPIIKTFLLFLNQNLSVAYHITRLESNRQVLENKVENSRKTIQRLEEEREVQKESEEDPGHLIEIFSHHKVDDLVARLFDRVKDGLKAEKLVFVSRPDPAGEEKTRHLLGIPDQSFSINGDEFQKIFGKLQKHQVYKTDHLRKIHGGERLMRHLDREKMGRVSTFALSESEQGLLFWSGKSEDEKAQNRLLSHLERVALRAMKNAVEFEKVEEMSYTDSLTALYNHRYFIKRLGEEIQRATRYNRKAGLLLFDIDDFKLYNDNFGHQWGDELLRRMGRTLTSSLRSIDIVSRYGGDEFGIIMPEADKPTCGVFMDRLRHAIASTDFRDRMNGFEGRITISIGSAIFPDDADSIERLIYCADMALFRSKDMGRNRSTIFTEELLEHNTSR